MWEYFVQCCAIVSRGNRNAPKQFPKAASLCFMNSVLYFAIHKGVVTTTSRGSKGTTFPRKIGKMRPTVTALLRILPQNGQSGSRSDEHTNTHGNKTTYLVVAVGVELCEITKTGTLIILCEIQTLRNVAHITYNNSLT